MELGNDDNGKKQAAAHIKSLNTLLTEENFAVLAELGGDVGDHTNKAMEVYVRWLHDQEGALPAAQEPVLVSTLHRKAKTGRVETTTAYHEFAV